MGQVTIYLANQIENKMKTAVKTSHLSVSKWIAKLIKDDELVKRSKTRWTWKNLHIRGTEIYHLFGVLGYVEKIVNLQ